MSARLTAEQRADVEAQLRADGLRLARDWHDAAPERGWYATVSIDTGHARIVVKVWATENENGGTR